MIKGLFILRNSLFIFLSRTILSIILLNTSACNKPCPIFILISIFFLYLLLLSSAILSVYFLKGVLIYIRVLGCNLLTLSLSLSVMVPIWFIIISLSLCPLNTVMQLSFFFANILLYLYTTIFIVLFTIYYAFMFLIFFDFVGVLEDIF